MNQIDVYSKHLARSWAASEINAPFVFVPLSLALNAAMHNTALEVVSNIPDAAFKVIAPNNSVSTKEGFYTGDGEAGTNPDTSYVFPGTAALDANTHALYNLFHLFKNAEPGGINGKILFLRWRGAPLATAATNGCVVSFGANTSPSVQQHGWRVGYTTTENVTMAAWSSTGTPLFTGQELIASPGSDNVEREYALLINFRDGNIRSWVNNAEGSPMGEVTILESASDQGNPSCGVTLFAGAGGGTPGVRSPLTTLGGFIRDFLAIDFTNYPGDIEAEAPTLVEALYRAPHYCLPRYMERY